MGGHFSPCKIQSEAMSELQLSVDIELLKNRAGFGGIYMQYHQKTEIAIRKINVNVYFSHEGNQFDADAIPEL